MILAISWNIFTAGTVYSCLTNQKQYYAENYPQMAIEKGNIDEVITMMIRGVE